MIAGTSGMLRKFQSDENPGWFHWGGNGNHIQAIQGPYTNHIRNLYVPLPFHYIPLVS